MLAANDRRLATLRAALGFLQLPSRTPELQLLHRWLDSWTGLGLVVVGVERQGLRFSLSHIGEGEWRAYFMRQSDVRAGGIRGGGNAMRRGVSAGGVGGSADAPVM